MWGLLLFVTYFFISLINAEIYLTTTGAAEWTGDCNQDCSFAAPCAITSTTIALTSDPCNISFLSGNYDGTPASWMVLSPPANLNISVSFISNITGLQLQLLAADANLEFQGMNGGRLISSRIRASSAEPKSKFNVSNLHFLDSTITNSGATSNVYISSCVFTSNNAYTGFLSEPSDLSRTNIFLTDVVAAVLASPMFRSVLVSTTSNGTITLNRVTGSYYQLVQRTTDDLKIEIFNSRLSVSFFSNEPARYPAVLVQDSRLEATEGAGPNEIHNLAVIRSEIINMNLVVKNNFTANNATFTGCAMAAPSTTPLTFDQVVVTLDRDSSSWTISSANAYQHSLRNLQVYVDPALTGFVGGAQQAAPFAFKGNVILRSDSSLTTNRLWLEPMSTLQINFLVVTELIACYIGEGPSYLYSSDSNSVWRFDSIRVENISVDTSVLTEFQYRATDPSKGIQLSGTAFFIPPPKVVIFWPTVGSLHNGTWYPLVNGATDSPGRVLPSNAIADEVDIVSQYSSDNLLITYSFLAKLTCAPPPTGFICVNGIWVVDGSGNATTVVIVPSNEGTVQVLGNLTVLGPIVFEGTGSSLNVSGCVNTPSVQIEIDSAKEVPSTPVLLIQQGKNCPNSLGNTLINVKQTSDSCKKVKAKQETTSQESLIVVFSVDESKCSKSWRWIVLGTVLGASAVVGALTLTIWKLAAPKFKSSRTAALPH